MSHLHYLGLAFLANVAAVSSLASANPNIVSFDASSDAKFASLLKFIQSDMSSSRAVGGAVVILENGKITHVAGLGAKALQSSDPVTAHTLFDVESFTKSVTAASVMKYVEKGAIDLKAPVTKYLPFFKVAPPIDSSAVTLREVLMMTSGIPSTPGNLDFGHLPFDPALAGSLAALFMDFNDQPLFSPPGEIWNYSNFGYGLLGLLLERVSGMDYTSNVNKNIIVPAGMADSTLEHSVAHKRDHAFVIGQKPDGAKISEDFTLQAESYWDRPWGGLYSSVSDIGRFAELLLDGKSKILARDTIQQMLDNQTFKGSGAGEYYGYGLHIFKGAFTGDESTDDLIAAATGDGNGPGDTALGTHTSLLIVPKQGFGVGFITNDGSYGGTHKIIAKAVNLFLGREVKEEVLTGRYKTDPSTWKDYIGQYEDAETLGKMDVTLENGRLFLNFPAQAFKTELSQFGGDTFIWNDLPPTLLKQYKMTEQEYENTPVFGGIFLRSSTSGPVKFLVTRAGIGQRFP